jgi:DNA-binding beta-propeller fold protein YncE
MSLFPMNARGMRVRLMQIMAAVTAAGMITGCGSNYRPVVTPINPSGPPAQPSSLAVVVSSPSPSTSAPGVATVIDYSGDSIVAQAPIGPAPIAFSVDENGATGYTVNSDGTLTNFPVSNQLQEKNITFSTLPAAAQSVGLFSPSAGLWVADLNGNVIDSLTGGPETFKLAIPVAPTPIGVFGLGTLGQHNYSISLNSSSTAAGGALAYSDMTCNTAPSTVTQNGEADSLETATFTVSAIIPLGKCPVYAVQSPDSRRLFVFNRGSDTITVINTQNNALDACTPFSNQNGQPVTCHPCLPLTATVVGTDNPAAPPGSTPGSCLEQTGSTLQTTGTAGPVYGEYLPATQQLVVANYDGGTISLIDVSLDQYGNDSPTFGTTFTIKVGNTATPNPASVTALADGSRAYTANQNDDSGTGNGTVTIVNLLSHTVEKTLAVTGHPRTVVSTQNSLFGKVYVASPDSPYLTIIRTDQDIIDTTILVQGNIVDVRTSTQNGSTGNAITTSRRPGAGQPCYLPGIAAEASLTTCQTLPQ